MQKQSLNLISIYGYFQLQSKWRKKWLLRSDAAWCYLCQLLRCPSTYTIIPYPHTTHIDGQTHRYMQTPPLAYRHRDIQTHIDTQRHILAYTDTYTEHVQRHTDIQIVRHTSTHRDTESHIYRHIDTQHTEYNDSQTDTDTNVSAKTSPHFKLTCNANFLPFPSSHFPHKCSQSSWRQSVGMGVEGTTKINLIFCSFSVLDYNPWLCTPHPRGGISGASGWGLSPVEGDRQGRARAGGGGRVQ